MNPVETVASAFADRVGRPPDGVWRAPGRVNLIGEHTDYNDGFVLPVAIDRSVVVAAGIREDGVLRSWSTRDRGGPVARPVSEVGPGTSSGWAAYVEGMAWVLREQGIAVPGADVVVHADLPAGAGLSSSAALEAAVGLAFLDLAGAGSATADSRPGGGPGTSDASAEGRSGTADSGPDGGPGTSDALAEGRSGTADSRPGGARGLDRVALALAGQRAETEVVGMPCGIMDQMAVLLGRAGHALFLDTRSRATELVPFDPAGRGLTLLVIDTRVKHALVGSPYAERRRACERAAASLGVAALRDVTLDDLEAARAAGKLDEVTFRRARHVVTENDRVLEVVAALRAGGIDRIGPALAASHTSLRDDYEVSCPELDVAVEAAVSGGAVAARMTGGGFGGSALALTPLDAAKRVEQAVGEAFAAAGFGPPVVFAVSIADGARRVSD